MFKIRKLIQKEKQQPINLSNKQLKYQRFKKLLKHLNLMQEDEIFNLENNKQIYL